ncbi:formylglycine-generating enzyme family protein [Candidatus Uabimicrobium sp. HlEnr_7]|uniref:formylglycine-generating enzyme family protein n=1 Tax=Candidatus Uabimicrobium helgolandensis TaxID=3095367 RepID=UPI0035570E79
MFWKKKIRTLTFEGFEYLRKEEYSCGGQTHVVDEYCHIKTGLEFVLIPAGSFTMGNDRGFHDEKPAHEVTLDSFLMAKTQVTQKVWKKFMPNNPSNFEGSDLPVEYVSWYDAQEFTQKVGLELPIEAQWEYSCRAGTVTKYYWGDNGDIADKFAWHEHNSSDETHPVGQKKPNAFGLHDVIGNVWEWCRDWYGQYNSNLQFSSTTKVLRGCSFNENLTFLHSALNSAQRYFDSPDFKSNLNGLRVSKSFSTR